MSAAAAPEVVRTYCPRCEPERDPLAGLVTPMPCGIHQERAGVDDARAQVSDMQPPAFEAGGEANRRWCEIFHRSRRP